MLTNQVIMNLMGMNYGINPKNTSFANNFLTTPSKMSNHLAASFNKKIQDGRVAHRKDYIEYKQFIYRISNIELPDNIQSDKFKFPGHTDYLNQELTGNSLMFMVAEKLRVGLLTDHVPVKDVSANISKEIIISKIETIHDSLVKDFGIRKPKIAVLGINPHTGDNGVIGSEDDTILRPTLKTIKDQGMLVYGPYAADSFFGSDNYLNFDAIVATYHDQGLIPFKTLSFGKGVNFTAGLNRVRTSPDHGTAYEIAGKGIADNSSFKEALYTAITIFKNRNLHTELTANPLKKQKT